MNERILNLLGLCMQCQEKGINAHFTYGRAGVEVIHFTPLEEDKEYKPEIIMMIFVGRSELTEKKLASAENYLKGLIV